MTDAMHQFLQAVLTNAHPCDVSYTLDPIDMTITTRTKVTDAQLRHASALLGTLTMKE